MRKILITSIILFLAIEIYAQDERQIDSYIENIVEQMASTSEDADIESIASDLESLYLNPININAATIEELEKLWVLNDFQIKSLIEYRKRMRQIVSIHELRYIFGFTDQLVDMVAPFVVCGPVQFAQEKNIKKILKRSRNEILIRTTYRDNISGNYRGSPVQQYFRYSGKFSNTLNISLIADKDAGEEFAKGSNPAGFDFYSGHVQISTKSYLKKLVLGDYRVRIGQGILIWNGYQSGKSSEITSIQKRGQGISGNTSKDEYNFLRGASATIGYNKYYISLWGSYKTLDGSMDTVENIPIIRSISKSGYHRTNTEILRKGNMHESAFGASIQYKSMRSNIGLNWVNHQFSIPIQSELEPYNYYDFNGTSNNGYSLDYKFLFQKTQFYGEVAYSNNALAGITGVNIMPTSQFTGNIFYRNYQPKYFSPYANAMVESGEINNEEGFFAGFKWYTDWKINLSVYSDVFSIPWISFNASAPLKGVDYLVELKYLPQRHFELILRYKYKEKEQNYKAESQNVSKIFYFQKQNLRIHAKYNINQGLRMASRFELSESGYTEYSKSTGYLLYQDFYYSITPSCNFYFRYARFNTDDYNSRIYAYENNVLYAYSIPAYHGNGEKFYLMIRQKVGKSLTLWIRYANTKSYNESIQRKNEFSAQVMLKF